MNNIRHRSQEEIVADILSVITKEPKKTHIMFGANLSYQLLCKYLNKLIDAELITCRSNSRVYELTNRGKLYLHEYYKYKQLESMLETNISALNEKKDVLAKILA